MGAREITKRGSDGRIEASVDSDGFLQVETRYEVTNLLKELLCEQKKTNQYLQIISGDELLDRTEET